MAVRPFYAKGYVDGRRTDVSFGPRTGGMNVSFMQKDKTFPGSIRNTFTIRCFTCEMMHEEKLQLCHVTDVIDAETGAVIVRKINPKG